MTPPPPREYINAFSYLGSPLFISTPEAIQPEEGRYVEFTRETTMAILDSNLTVDTGSILSGFLISTVRATQVTVRSSDFTLETDFDEEAQDPLPPPSGPEFDLDQPQEPPTRWSRGFYTGRLGFW